MATGIIVAGGESSRFGHEDKALASIDGVPMIRHVVDRVVPLVDEIVVNLRRDQRSAVSTALSDVARPIEFAIDHQAGGGPVAGLETVLDVVDDGDALVLPCDLPLIRTETLSALLDRLDDPVADAPIDCVLPLVGGYPEPLCGAYDLAGLRSAIDELGQSNNRAVNDLLEHLRASTVPHDELPGTRRVYENVNTPEELQDVRRIVRTDEYPDPTPTASRK